MNMIATALTGELSNLLALLIVSTITALVTQTARWGVTAWQDFWRRKREKATGANAKAMDAAERIASNIVAPVLAGEGVAEAKARMAELVKGFEREFADTIRRTGTASISGAASRLVADALSRKAEQLATTAITAAIPTAPGAKPIDVAEVRDAATKLLEVAGRIPNAAQWVR